MMTKGAPGIDAPATFRSAATRCSSYQSDGISRARCGSLASSGRPVLVRVPDTTQLLLPAGRAARSNHSRPGGSGLVAGAFESGSAEAVAGATIGGDGANRGAPAGRIVGAH